MSIPEIKYFLDEIGMTNSLNSEPAQVICHAMLYIIEKNRSQSIAYMHFAFTSKVLHSLL